MLWRLSSALPELPGYWGVDDRLDAFEARWDRGPALILVSYGEPYQRRVDLPQTVGDALTYSALQQRGMWIERRDEPIVWAELQWELVDALRAQHPDLPVHVLVLRADARRDELIDLPAVTAVQVQDLGLPVDPVAWD